MAKSENLTLIFCFSFSFSIMAVLLILYLTASISGIILKSIIFGFFIAFLNLLLGLISRRFSITQSEKIFLLVLWGGMLFRMIFGLILILISLIFLEINTYGFIFSILFFYVFYILIEIFYLNLGRKSRFGDE